MQQRTLPFPALMTAGIGFLTILVGLLVGIGGGFVAVGLLAGLIILFTLARDFRVGAGLLMLLLPLASTTIMPRQMFGVTGANPVNIMLALTLGSLFMAWLFGWVRLMPVPWRFYGPILTLLLIGAYLGSSKVHMIAMHFYVEDATMYRTAGQYIRDEFFKPVLTLTGFWVIATAVAASKKPERWLTLYGVAVIMLPLLVIMVVLRSGLSLHALASPAARGVMAVTGLHANIFSVLLLPAFSASLFMLPTVTGLVRRLFWLAVVGATLVGLMLTFSRAAFLGVLLVTFVFFFLRGQFRYIFFGLLAAAVVAVSLPDAFIERATTGMDSGNHVGGHNDALTAGRVGGIWIPLLPEVAKHPWLGDGINSTLWSLPSRQGVFVEGHPHNAYLRMMMDHGLLGILVIGYFMLQVWRLYRRLSKDERLSPSARAFFQGTRIAFMIFFVQCMSGSNLMLDVPQVLYWISTAIGLGLEFSLRRKEAASPDPAR